MDICLKRKPAWFVLYTAPRSEKKVYERLLMQGVEAYLPLHATPRVWSDRVKIVEMPLFSSYIFVHVPEHKLRDLLSVYGVVKTIYYNGAPAKVRDSEIKAIQEFVELSKAREVTFDLDEEVMVAAGPFKDTSGKIVKVGKEYLILHIEQLGMTASVQLNKEAIKKKG
ncbi:MAG: UpxY family transcription antiterminator [Bacteroidales bacterium]